MFELLRTTPMPFYNGTGYFYRHDTTHMEVFCLRNNSDELTGAFTFATPSQDNTGVAHIIEHTVLSGSERFPVKDPFIEIINSSPNTFLNAMTFPDKTMYPFSSPLKKDFDIIFDIYADAVFCPLLRRQSFEQEGVRFYGDKIDGVVFNEMRGARSAEDDVASIYSATKLFAGTPYQYDSGGAPENIADLTYEQYIERYKKWYHPSNCRLFLFGNLEPQEYLDKIEKTYLASYKDSTENNKIELLPQNVKVMQSEPQRDIRYCSTKNANTVLLTWLTVNGNDPLECMTLSILTEILLGEPGSPLYKAITESKLGKDLSSVSGMTSDLPILPFSVGIVGANLNQEDEIESFILNTLKEIAQNGLDKNEVQATLKREEFKLKEVQGGGYPYGILVAMNANRYWLYGVPVEDSLNIEKTLKQIQEKVKQGNYFENWILNHLVNNPKRCLLTVKGDQQYEEKLCQQLSAKYAESVKKIPSEIYEKNFNEYQKFIHTEDSEEIRKKIPRITKNDIILRTPNHSVNKKEINNVPVCYNYISTNKISYLNFIFDVTDFSQNEIRLIPLLAHFMRMCSTEKHTYTEVETLIKQFTGSFAIYKHTTRHQNGKRKTYVVIKTKTLNTDVAETLNLTSEVITQCKLEDKPRLLATLINIISQFESTYLDAAHYYSGICAAASVSDVGLETELTTGTHFYLYMSSLLKNFDKNYPDLCGKLRHLHNKIFTTSGLQIYACIEENFEQTLLPLVSEFLQTIPDRVSNTEEICTESDTIKQTFVPAQKTLIHVSGGPSYNSSAFKFTANSPKEMAEVSLFASIIGGNYIFKNVRGKNGAYGAQAHMEHDDKMFYMSSYRDPKIEDTYKIFEESLSFIPTQEEIDFSVVTMLGRELAPQIPKIFAAESLTYLLNGFNDTMYLERRKALLSLTQEDLKRVSEQLTEEYKKHCECTVTSDITAIKDAKIVELPM